MIPDAVRGRIRQLRALFRKASVERDMAEEFEFHIRMQIEQYVRDGLSPAEARRRAMLEFGGVDRFKEGVRDARWTRVLEDTMSDIRWALRALRRNPVFAMVAVLTIAIGIGATTAVASMINAVLVRPLPAVASPAGLYDLTESRSGMTSNVLGYEAMPWPRYEKYATATADVWSGLAAHRYDGFSLATARGAIAVNGSLTSRNYFDVLGVRPALGRFYGEGDTNALVLGHTLWSTRFGSDPGAVGRTIRLDSRPFTIVGVAPAGFTGTSVGIRSDLWAPLPDYWAGDPMESWYTWVTVFGRLADGVEVPRAGSVVRAAAVNIPPEQTWTTIHGASLVPVTGIPVVARTGFSAFLAMLFATAGIVLMIAAGNVAGMLLARATARGREIAIRLAIGVGRRRLMGQLLVESMVLFVIGGAAGVLLAFWLTSWLVRTIPSLPATVSLDVSPDLRVLTFALVISALTGVLFGLAPALYATRADVTDMLKRGGTRTRSRLRGRSVFVGAQFAMSVVLVVTGGLFVRSLRAAVATDLGFDPRDVLVADINLRPHGYDAARVRAFWDELLERVRAMPGVESAGIAEWPLLAGASNGGGVRADVAGDTEANHTNARHDAVDAAWFDVMRVPVIAGRTFTDADDASSGPVVIVNETLAARLWPGEPPLGQRLFVNGRSREVVGVTGDGKYTEIGEPPTAIVYFPFGQRSPFAMTLHIRSAVGPARLIESLRAEMSEVDPDIAFGNAGPLAPMVALTMFPQRLAAWLIGGFGLGGLLLATIGVYGVLAFEVARGTREFGIRGALGARARQLVTVVVGRGLIVAGAGTATGLALAAIVTRFIGTFLYGTDPLDPMTFAAAAALMLAVAAVAAAIPARRASRIAPMEALRAD